jgi:hypothetical protein
MMRVNVGLIGYKFMGKVSGVRGGETALSSVSSTARDEERE